jgi:hypothetical protein
MRPTKHSQSALAHPLNAILGTEANVRVLREVLLSDVPIGLADIARTTMLQRSGIAAVCDRLEDQGVIESVGRSRSRQYRKASRGGLAPHLAALFNEERSRLTLILNEVRSAAQQVSGMIRAAWIEGPVAEGTDRSGDPIVVGAIAEAADLESARQTLWTVLLRVQHDRDVAIELRLQTIADLQTADTAYLRQLETARPLVGAPPAELARPTPPNPAVSPPTRRRHEDADAQLLRLADAIASRIQRDASVIERARDYLERRLTTAAGRERLELLEWQGILATMSASRVRRLLVSDDARGRRLRQTLPFVDTLSAGERRRIVADGSELA